MMDFLNSKVKPMYFKYLVAAFGSALISSIYGVVDMAMVGQYQGPDGTAALAVVSPIWNIIYSLGLLMGIGGSVLFSTIRGESEDNQQRSNEYFSTAFIGTVILAVIAWIAVAFFDKELLLLFGAEETLLPLAQQYVLPVKFAVPSFLFTQLISAFLRNDGNPGLATKAVIFGGVFNVFGDYFFVFTMDWGIFGAGLATVLGSVFSLIIMCSHFFSKRNTLYFVKPTSLMNKLKTIIVTGFSTFFIDVAMGILTVLFNRQILKYLGTDALSVYGIIINISTFVQCCAYSIGQASQPIISVNFGAHQGHRIKEVLKYAMGTAMVFGVIWTGLSLAVPNLFVRIFMTPTESILAIAPMIIRSYGISFLLLPLNIFSTYYFQAIMKPSTSFIVSVARGAVISGILIMVLPAVTAPESIWFAMLITELIVTIYVLNRIKVYTQKLDNKEIKTNHKIVTISREFGSGGRELGRRLAESLEYAYYDHEIIEELSKRTHLSQDYIQQIYENKKPVFPIHIGRTFQNIDMSIDEKIYQQQCQIILEIANKSDCVIVGRCADYILNDMNPFKIFVSSDMKSKIQRCKERGVDSKDLSDIELEEYIHKVNKNRKRYYELHTGQRWGDFEQYDLCINTSKTSIKEAVSMIVNLLKGAK